VAPNCCEKSCRNDGSVIFDERSIFCANHAREEIRRRKMDIGWQTTPTFGARPLIDPKIDICVILRDEMPSTKGRIIIPEVAKDCLGRIKGEDQYATGLVLAVGPGYQARRYGAGSQYIRGRKSLRSRPGMHVIFRAKYEQAIFMWRGLALVHDFDVLAEVPIEEEAA
jgi:hypothetical protein